MNTRARATILLATGISVLLLIASPALADSYTLTLIGALPGDDSSSAVALNNQGQVLGTSRSSSDSARYHVFLSEPNGGALQDISLLSDQNRAFLGGVNDAGQIVGYASGLAPYASVAQGFLLDANGGSSLQRLGFLLPGDYQSFAYGVNNNGQVTGYSYGNIRTQQAFLSGPDGGALRGLGFLPGYNMSFGIGVNNSGQVVGYVNFWDGQHGHIQAFLSEPNGGALKGLGTLPGTSESMGRAVNDSGQVVGTSFSPFGYSTALISGPNGGAIQPLPLPRFGLSSPVPMAINNKGVVVGSATNGADDSTTGFLFDGTSTLIDLNSFLDPGSPIRIGNAVDINEAGQITGNAYNSLTGTHQAYLLTPTVAPIPEPPSLLLMGVGLIGIAVGLRRGWNSDV